MYTKPIAFRFFLSLLGIIMLMSPVAANAQVKTADDIRLDSTVRSEKVILFGKGESVSQDSINRLIYRFYADQFRHFQDPLAPYFLFMSKDANLAMGIGGVVRMRGYYDWAGAIPSPAFAPYLIPMQENPTRKRYLGSTPAGTALFFRVLGMNKKFGQYQLYIEANFNGYEARDFRLKKAYGQINDWTIGYTNSTFSDPMALPPVVDAAGPNAKMDATAVLIRWCHEWKKGWSLAASIEQPEGIVDAKQGETAAVARYIPDVAVFGQFARGSSHIRLSGITRTLSYRDLLTKTNHNVLGWGLQLSGKYSPHPLVTIYGALNGGQGFQSLGGDWLMGKYDLVNDDSKPGSMYAPGALGGYAALQVNINPMMFFSATFGGTRYLPKHNPDPSEYKTGMIMAVNYYWYLTQRISCAVEFDLGRRGNMDGSSAWAHRLGLMAQFAF